MWPIVGAAVAGVLFARNKAPKTRVKKLQVLGTRSGLHWQVEDFPELGVVIARGEGGVMAVFRRTETGFVFQHGQGDRKTLRLLLLDFNQDRPPKAKPGTSTKT
jgi:hypothetical protein